MVRLSKPERNRKARIKELIDKGCGLSLLKVCKEVSIYTTIALITRLPTVNVKPCMLNLKPILLLILLLGCQQQAPDDGRKPVSVFVLPISSDQMGFFAWAETEFEQQWPDVDIQIEQFPGSSLKDYEIKLRLRYASGNAPDIWYFRENELAEYVDLGLIAPAPDYIERIVQENSVNEMIRQAPYFDGICYGIVHHAGWTVLYYNKAHFREAGLDPDSPPTTWDELVAYADRLTLRAPDNTIKRTGFSLRKTGYKQGTAEKWLTFFYSAGGVPFNESGTVSYFDSEAARAAFTLYNSVLFDKNIDSVTLDGDQRGFGQGRVSMFIREDHVIYWLNENFPEIEYGIAPIPPLNTTYPSFSSGGAFPMVVNQESQHKEEAWRFLEFLLQDEVYLRYVRAVKAQPVLLSVAELPEFKDNPMLQVYRNQPVYLPPKFAHDRYSLELIGTYVERFAYGHLSVEETIERMTQEINVQLQLAAP